ncbi:SAM-dependent methyltransferase [Mumia sp. zg.B21]|uniref:SAM-dependent methyltransferase n=1 Tax=Mumia sp. zg.B21 TaxID=2855447 RepID=UPI001C6E6490|nr:SAM-dependent methyltransferase [Mumia sp. zg.B21]MBW9209527.1 SAM-dependent methyltransferase [Mumia sp. zg.B21]
MIAWREAWQEALYGPGGFYRREHPVDHFRTSVHASDAFAAAVLTYVRRTGLRAVVDAGAGRGELLRTLDAAAPGELDLHGVDLRPRPDDLPPTIGWSPEVPDSVDGLLIANELLDNLPCDVVERDEDGSLRVVMVDPATGEEELGPLVRDPDTLAWLDRWWPCPDPGERAEVGLSREAWWRDAVGRVVRGAAIAIDYGHRADDRPPFGSLRAYRSGAEVDVVPDGTRDVTAHVAVDALADAVGGTLRRQRDVLRDLGVVGARPPLTLASTDPHAYLAALAAASEAAELTAAGGLGDFWWIVTEVP